MIVEQYQLACLSLSSYLIGDEASGKAVVIDPQRDIAQYLADAEARGLTIGHVLLTHFHADYVSGHLELAEATGAEICFGEPAEAEFPIRQLHDGDRIELGDVVIETWSTPGHTPESVTYLLFETADAPAPTAIFTGDTLFVNDVGRPDLLGAIGFTADELGRKLYHSLGRLTGLPDEVRVYPGHGAGSACGKALGSEPYTTIGEQKTANYALQPMSEDDFVDLVTEGQPAAPAYFLHDAITNRSTHSVFDQAAQIPALGLDQVDAARAGGAVVVDTRDPARFASGHLAGAVNVPIDGRFAEMAGMVVGADTDVIVAGEAGSEREARTRLGRIGFDRVTGHVADYEAALAADPDRAVQAERIPATRVAAEQADHSLVLDVRNPGETALGTVPGSTVIPLAALPQRIGELDPSTRVVVYCAGGTRSSVAASFLRSNGFGDVADVVGGYDAWSTLAATGA
jgi:glyoxylase-like metal-dependent hydrolase (beta-lactamase superfamily II)/rhodanese-related sulfurtransferase